MDRVLGVVSILLIGLVRPGAAPGQAPPGVCVAMIASAPPPAPSLAVVIFIDARRGARDVRCSTGCPGAALRRLAVSCSTRCATYRYPPRRAGQRAGRVDRRPGAAHPAGVAARARARDRGAARRLLRLHPDHPARHAPADHDQRDRHEPGGVRLVLRRDRRAAAPRPSRCPCSSSRWASSGNLPGGVAVRGRTGVGPGARTARSAQGLETEGRRLRIESTDAPVPERSLLHHAPRRRGCRPVRRARRRAARPRAVVWRARRRRVRRALPAGAPPGLPVGWRLLGRRHVAGWAAGVLVGYAFTSLARGCHPAGRADRPRIRGGVDRVTATTWLAPRPTSDPLVPLPPFTRRDAAALLVVLLLVAGFLSRPLGRVGAQDASGQPLLPRVLHRRLRLARGAHAGGRPARVAAA